MGKSGQRRAQHNLPFYKRIHRKLAPHQYLENQLVQLEKLDDDARQLWAGFQNYLAEEREKVLDQITTALIESSVSNFSGGKHSRIVGSKFSLTPLSSKGSYLSPPGGRFNFGQSISYQSYFPALYIASDYDVAYCEKFHCKEDELLDNGLSCLDLGLRKPESFTHQRVDFCLDHIIDLRESQAIDAFFNIIKHIKMPKIYSSQAKKLNIPMIMVPDSDFLRDSIFDLNYEQWDYWIDQPSPSQWFGHYVRLAGIQGIVYPSVRLDTGYDIAIFVDQFEDSQSFVELADDCDFVENDQRKIDSSNFQKFG